MITLISTRCPFWGGTPWRARRDNRVQPGSATSQANLQGEEEEGGLGLGAQEARKRQGACTQAVAQCPQPWPLVSAWHAPRTLPLA